MRKSVFAICEQQRRRSVSASDNRQTDKQTVNWTPTLCGAEADMTKKRYGCKVLIQWRFSLHLPPGGNPANLIIILPINLFANIYEDLHLQAFNNTFVSFPVSHLQINTKHSFCLSFCWNGRESNSINLETFSLKCFHIIPQVSKKYVCSVHLNEKWAESAKSLNTKRPEHVN